MLTAIRDRASGWIAAIIVGALIISFAFWGVSFYFGDGPELNVASVNDEQISQRAFQRSFQNFRQRMQAMFGGSFSLEEDELIRQQTLQSLIDAELINQIVRRQGLRVPDAMVIRAIKDLELFKDEEGFDRGKYERGIFSLGMDPAYFENQVRMDLLSEQLQAGLAESLFVLAEETARVWRLGAETRDIRYAILERGRFMDEVEVSAEEISEYYAANPADYLEPEQVRIAYVELNLDQIAASIPVDAASLRAYYEDNRAEYDIAEQRSLQRLSVKTAAGESTPPGDGAGAEARAVIEGALALASEGREFAEIAAQFSAEGKALEFSEHDFMTRGVMDAEIDAFLFSAAEAELSGIIATATGLNIVKVGAISGGPDNGFESAAPRVEQDYRLAQAEARYFELADELVTLSYEHPDTLEVAAEAAGLKINETGYFSQDSGATEGISANAAILTQSFDPDLIQSGQNSDAIELGQNHIAVLRVIDHKPAQTRPLAEAREQVLTDLRHKKAAAKAEQFGQAILAGLKAGQPDSALETALEVEWSAVEGVKRDDVLVSRAILRHAFRLGKPENGQPLMTGAALGSGDYALVVVTAAQEGEAAPADEDLRQDLDLELKRARGGAEWRGFLQNARDNASVDIYRENI